MKRAHTLSLTHKTAHGTGYHVRNCPALNTENQNPTHPMPTSASFLLQADLASFTLT